MGHSAIPFHNGAKWTDVTGALQKTKWKASGGDGASCVATRRRGEKVTRWIGKEKVGVVRTDVLRLGISEKGLAGRGPPEPSVKRRDGVGEPGVVPSRTMLSLIDEEPRVERTCPDCQRSQGRAG